MEKIYKFETEGFLGNLVGLIFLLMFFSLLILSFQNDALRKFIWLFATMFVGACVVGIKANLNRLSYLKIFENQLQYYAYKRLKWSVNISQITEIDKQQSHQPKPDYSFSDVISMNVRRENIGFSLSANSQIYTVEDFLSQTNFNNFLQDLININPSIHITDLSEKLSADFNKESMGDYFQKRYGKSGIFKPVVWFGKQNALVAAIIVIGFLILTFFVIPYLFSKW